MCLFWHYPQTTPLQISMVYERPWPNPVESTTQLKMLRGFDLRTWDNRSYFGLDLSRERSVRRRSGPGLRQVFTILYQWPSIAGYVCDDE